MNLVLENPHELDDAVRRALESIVAQISATWDREHNDDGTHGTVTVDSLNSARPVSITLANGATASLALLDTPEPFAWVLIKASDNAPAIYVLDGLGHTTYEVSDPAGVYTATAGSASSYNVYWSSTNNRYELENKGGATRTFSLLYLIAG